MKRLLNLFLAAFLAFAPVAQAELRAVSPPSVIMLAQSWVAVSAPADANEDTLATITIPANTIGPNGALRISTAWSFTNSANSKTLRIRYSGGAGTQYLNLGLTAASRFTDQRIIANVNATNSQVGSAPAGTNPFAADTGTIPVTSAVDTTAATTIVITGQKALNTETITLVGFTVEVIH